MYPSYASSCLKLLTSHHGLEIMLILAEGPSTIDALVSRTGFQRRKILAVTKELESAGVVNRPVKHRLVDGQITARQTSLLAECMANFFDYLSAIHREQAEAAKQRANRISEVTGEMQSKDGRRLMVVK